MAVLTVVQEPPKFQSAYKPLLVGLTSQRSPANGIAGETVSISDIRAATATDVTTYGNGLEVGDIIVIHAVVFGLTFVRGQMVRIGLTQNYDGQLRILKVINTQVTVIDVEDLGVETSGRIEKFYENYTLIALVTMEAATAPIRYEIQFDKADNRFYLDASDAAQRTFKDVFEIAEGGNPLEFIKANQYITQQWSVAFSEAYMIPNANGINVFTERGKNGATAKVTGKVAVNSVQPYHHIDEGNGEPDHQWMEDLDAYQIDASSGDDKRFLTYAPRGGTTTYDQRSSMRIGSEDDFWLAILHGPGTAGRFDLRMVFFNAQGSIITQTDQDYSIIAADSFLFNVGPNAITLPSGTHHYYVEFNNTPVGSYSERFYVTIDDQCNLVSRFFFFNSFGTIDQYTVENPQSRETGVKRFVVEKPNMALRLQTRRGDYQRRTYRTEVTKGYSATMRKEGKQVLRWLGDEFATSPDVRMVIYDHDETIYTPVILTMEDFKMGFRGGRQSIEWELGVDNKRQRR